jgi:hypothetical protein
MTLKIRVKEVAIEFKSFNELEKGDLFRKSHQERLTVFIKIDGVSYSVLSLEGETRARGGLYEMHQAERHMHNCVPINGTLEIES